MAQTLAAVFSLNDKYTATITKIMKSQDAYEKKARQVDKATENFGKRMAHIKADADKGGGGVSSLAAKIGGLVSIAYIGQKALSGMFSAINTSALQQVQETTFQALLNSDKIGSQLYAYVGAYAKTSALGREDIAKGVTSFLTVSRDINQIEQLIKMTERLYAKDPTQGAEGAVFALKEALAGDTISLRNRYGITGLSGESLRGADTAGKLEQIDSALNQFGATQAVVDKNFNNLSTQINIFKSNLRTAIGEEATPAMMTLSGVVQRLNADMEAGKFQPFINLMIGGMEFIGNAIAWVADNATWLIPVLAGVVTGIIAYNIATAAAAVVTMAAFGNWAGIALMAVGVTAAVVGMGAAMADVEAKSATVGTNLADAKNQLGTSLPTTKTPVEITNTAPISVTGTVDIEQENIKYLMDMAGQKFFAQYSHNTVVPQNQTTVYVEKTADANEVVGIIEQSLTQALNTAPQGAYE